MGRRVRGREGGGPLSNKEAVTGDSQTLAVSIACWSGSCDCVRVFVDRVLVRVQVGVGPAAVDEPQSGGECKKNAQLQHFHRGKAGR